MNENIENQVDGKILKSEKNIINAKAGKRSTKSIKEQELKIAKEERKLAQKSDENTTKTVIKKKTRSLLERKSKNYRKSSNLIDKKLEYKLTDAVDIIKKTSTTKFDSSVELHVRLNVNPKQADQNIRDTIILPFGTGKKLKIAVLTEDSKLAKDSGADIFVKEDIFSSLDKNIIDFDILITTPDMMPKLSKYARILGPRGIMPNPKSGTVTTDINKAINESKSGKIEYRVDSYGIVHAPVGKVSFDSTKLVENINSFFTNLKSNKPQSVKTAFIKTAFISTTMGPSIKLETTDLLN